MPSWTDPKTTPVSHSKPEKQVGGSPPCRTVADLVGLYQAHCLGVYVKFAAPTKTALNAVKATDLLVHCGLGDRPLAIFGPLMLGSFQEWLARDRSLITEDDAAGQCQWTRSTINEYVRHVQRMFRWAASRELVGPAVWQSLAAVCPLRRGRPPALGLAPPREGRKRRPVPERDLDAVLALAPPMLAAMIRLQVQTGMRPGELVHVSPQYLHSTRDPSVVAYHVPPEANKTEWLDIDRRVYLGPRAMQILLPWLPADPSRYAFDPGRAEAERLAARRATRKSKRWPSHATEERRRRRGQEPAQLGDHYTADSYRRAITRVCDAADVPRWTPYQLRHNAATEITERASIEVAKEVLGHRDIATTMRYANVPERRLVASAASIG
ncbi:MAG: tyrosine-type recombinase/integrase [Phycisphaerales bacterium]|nr:tyrosine-type recombinase/integrase [Phycisphaerales bacterium]